MELKFEFTTKGRGAVIVTVTVDDSFKIRALSCSNSVMDQVFEDPNKLKLMQDHVDSECAGTPGSNFITLNVRKRRVEFKVTRISWLLVLFFVRLAGPPASSCYLWKFVSWNYNNNCYTRVHKKTKQWNRKNIRMSVLESQTLILVITLFCASRLIKNKIVQFLKFLVSRIRILWGLLWEVVI